MKKYVLALSLLAATALSSDAKKRHGNTNDVVLKATYECIVANGAYRSSMEDYEYRLNNLQLYARKSSSDTTKYTVIIKSDSVIVVILIDEKLAKSINGPELSDSMLTCKSEDMTERVLAWVNNPNK